MGLFDKIVKEVGKAVGNKVADDILGRSGLSGNSNYGASNVEPKVSVSPSYSVTEDPGPSGFSWGEVMPPEENQYNYSGPYYRYFEEVFRSAFPDCAITSEKAPYSDRYTFTFVCTGRTVLIVEVLPDNSSVYATREKCRKEGIGYTRFYHNHHGWWNTREYVIKRATEAMRG